MRVQSKEVLFFFFLINKRQANSKIYMERPRTRKAETILKKTKLGGSYHQTLRPPIKLQ